MVHITKFEDLTPLKKQENGEGTQKNEKKKVEDRSGCIYRKSEEEEDGKPTGKARGEKKQKEVYVCGCVWNDKIVV
jgi:hypothetical protein